MPITIPDYSWYRKKSLEADAPISCPYANVHKCHRYYASIYMLGEMKMITSIQADEKEDLDIFWKKTNLLPVIEEDDTGIVKDGTKVASVSNFCPEVSFKYFKYYASYLARYADEIDEDCGVRIATRENLSNNWRYEWAYVTACHFLDCGVFSQVQIFNTKIIGKFDHLAHSNILILIGRMEQCLENNDPSGVLHAAANILETTAKDIVGASGISNKTLGSFIDKYKKESFLPAEIKNVVGNIYNLRSKMPLSGHGSIEVPNISMHDAILIAAATKFIVEVEYRTKRL